MEIYQGENEQIAILKEYLNKYKRLALVSITLVVATMIASGYWRHHKKVKIAQASDIYQQMLFADYRQDEQTLVAKGDLLLKNYSNTPYAQLAGMLLAKNSIAASDLNKAQEYLQSSKGIADPLAKLRVAKIMLQRGELDDALKVLNAQKVTDAYVSLYEELKGDIYLAKGDRKQAKDAYAKAMEKLPQGVQSQVLQMKYLDLGVEASDA